MEEKTVTKKKSIFGKIKDKWKSIPYEDRIWLKVVSVWFFDGLLIGGGVVAIRKDKQANKYIDVAKKVGYVQGQMDAYKEMAQNNYKPVNNPKNH